MPYGAALPPRPGTADSPPSGVTPGERAPSGRQPHTPPPGPALPAGSPPFGPSFVEASGQASGPNPFAVAGTVADKPVWARPGVLMAAAAAVVVLLVGGASFLAGRAGWFGARASGSSSPGLLGGGAPSASTTPSDATPLIYRCPTDADSAVWGCLKSVTSNGSDRLDLRYTTNFPLSAVQDAAHYHFHIYLANPGPNDTTVPADAAMQHVPQPGSWYIVYDGNVTTIDNTTDRGGQKLKLDLSGKYSLLCVRVATGLHGLANDSKGGYRTGNCAKITVAP
jgi:hypothetical protein